MLARRRPSSNSQLAQPAALRLPCSCLQDVLFEPQTYKVVSKHHNLVAFSVDMALMLKVLRSAVAHDADTLDMKLAMRRLPTTSACAGQGAGWGC